jgi:tRNA G18 (ribose-2'-O)-methylase SpoU
MSSTPTASGVRSDATTTIEGVSERVDRLDDPRLDVFRHVGDPAWLLAHGLLVAEGRLVVERLLLQPRYRVVSLLVTPTAYDALQPRLPAGVEALIAAPAVVAQVTGFNFHRGCLALAERPPRASVESIAAARALVALEGVGNPDNIGGIFRSAAALAAQGVALDPACGDPFYRKAIRTSMGATLRLPFATLAPWPAALLELKQAGFTIAALTPSGTTVVDALPEIARGSSRIALLAGAEGPGLTAGALAHADVTVRIPVDPASDSLNVVVAVSIALQRLGRWG